MGQVRQLDRGQEEEGVILGWKITSVLALPDLSWMFSLSRILPVTLLHLPSSPPESLEGDGASRSEAPLQPGDSALRLSEPSP